MSKFQSFKEYVKKKSRTVVGIGISNLPLINLSCDCGATVTVCDKRTEAELGETPLKFMSPLGIFPLVEG